MNFLMMCPNEELIDIVFPSPTGITYYEFRDGQCSAYERRQCFRPQQGLPIMNYAYIGAIM